MTWPCLLLLRVTRLNSSGAQSLWLPLCLTHALLSPRASSPLLLIPQNPSSGSLPGRPHSLGWAHPLGAPTHCARGFCYCPCPLWCNSLGVVCASPHSFSLSVRLHFCSALLHSLARRRRLYVDKVSLGTLSSFAVYPVTSGSHCSNWLRNQATAS